MFKPYNMPSIHGVCRPANIQFTLAVIYFTPAPILSGECHLVLPGALESQQSWNSNRELTAATQTRDPEHGSIKDARQLSYTYHRSPLAGKTVPRKG